MYMQYDIHRQTTISKFCMSLYIYLEPFVPTLVTKSGPLQGFFG